jgi:hypothetical protein
MDPLQEAQGISSELSASISSIAEQRFSFTGDNPNAHSSFNQRKRRPGDRPRWTCAWASAHASVGDCSCKARNCFHAAVNSRCSALSASDHMLVFPVCVLSRHIARAWGSACALEGTFLRSFPNTTPVGYQTTG